MLHCGSDFLGGFEREFVKQFVAVPPFGRRRRRPNSLFDRNRRRPLFGQAQWDDLGFS